MKNENIFYVYEHWRPDIDFCFYVGKGKGKRSASFKRNNIHYNRVVKKLAKLGMCVEVRMVASGLFEKEAFDLEIERIAFWRLAGTKLTNSTNGGEGATGLVWSKKSRRLARKISKKRMASKKIRKAISKKLKGRSHEGEALENFLAAMAKRKGVKLKPFSAKTKKNMSRSAKLREKPSVETRKKMSVSHTGSKRTSETKAKMSASAKLAQKLRFEKEKSTPRGRKALKERMRKVSVKGRGTVEYSERKRKAAIARWKKEKELT